MSIPAYNLTPAPELSGLDWSDISIDRSQAEAQPPTEQVHSASILRHGTVRIGSTIVKYTMECPLTPSDTVPLLLVPGYGGIKPAYRELRHSIAANGKPAVTFRPPRSQKKFAMFHPNHALHPERLLAQAAIGIAREVINRYGEEDGFQQIDAAGHSMGGPGVTNAALTRPEWFRSITVVASAGLDGHRLVDMAKRAPGVLVGEILPSIKDIKVRKDIKAAWDFAHYIARNPWRTAAEGLSVGSGDIRDKVVRVGELGVKTAAVAFMKDRFFPIEGVILQAADRFQLFGVFTDPEAGHMTPQLQPEALGAFLVRVVQTLNTPYQEAA